MPTFTFSISKTGEINKMTLLTNLWPMNKSNSKNKVYKFYKKNLTNYLKSNSPQETILFSNK